MVTAFRPLHPSVVVVAKGDCKVMYVDYNAKKGLVTFYPDYNYARAGQYPFVELDGDAYNKLIPDLESNGRVCMTCKTSRLEHFRDRVRTIADYKTDTLPVGHPVVRSSVDIITCRCGIYFVRVKVNGKTRCYRATNTRSQAATNRFTVDADVLNAAAFGNGLGVPAPEPMNLDNLTQQLRTGAGATQPWPTRWPPTNLWGEPGATPVPPPPPRRTARQTTAAASNIPPAPGFRFVSLGDVPQVTETPQPRRERVPRQLDEPEEVL
jgi:hypothetical protein